MVTRTQIGWVVSFEYQGSTELLNNKGNFRRFAPGSTRQLNPKVFKTEKAALKALSTVQGLGVGSVRPYVLETFTTKQKAWDGIALLK